MKKFFILFIGLGLFFPSISEAKSYITQYPTNQVYEDSIGIPRIRTIRKTRTRNLRKHNNRIPSPYYHNYNNINALSNLTVYEKNLFNRSFKGENDLNRLARLEQELFGTIHSGDINNRYNNISRALENRTRINRTSNFLDTIGNLFSKGYPTGYSPSLDSFNLGGYGGTQGFIADDNWLNQNYHEFENAFDSTSRIRILD